METGIVLLSEQEEKVLRVLSREQSVYGQRALALLALASGDSVEEAARASGLRDTQVKYWIPRFSCKRLEIFPEEKRVSDDAVTEAPQPVQEEVVVACDCQDCCQAVVLPVSKAVKKENTKNKKKEQKEKKGKKKEGKSKKEKKESKKKNSKKKKK